MAEIAGAFAGRSDDPALHSMAGCPERDAEKAMQKALTKFDLTLSVPVTYIDVGGEHPVPCLKPTDYIQTMSDRGYLHRVLGCSVDSCDLTKIQINICFFLQCLYVICSLPFISTPTSFAAIPCLGKHVLPQFWARLKVLEPDLQVFRDLDSGVLADSTLVPLLVHGDGGRTFKRDELMVVQFQPVLGQGTRKSCLARPGSIGVNLKGHSFTTRFLFGVMQKVMYSADPLTFQCFLEEFARDLEKLYYTGIYHERTATNLKFAVIGVKGDLPFLAKAGNMNRTYLHIRKHRPGPNSKPLTGCCWLCLAGSERADGTPVPFEDFSDSALWLSTRGTSNMYPWENFPPFVQYLPFSLSDAPGFFKLDVLHIYHLGIGRDFSASSLVYILTNLYEGSSVPENLETMNADLKQFLKETKKHIHFKKLSRDMLGFASTSVYPSGHWSKGMDTPIMIQFVGWLLNKFDATSRVDLLLKAGCDAIDDCMTTMLSASLWMTPLEAQSVGLGAVKFLRVYGKMALHFWNEGCCLFNMVLKLHMFHHLGLNVLDAVNSGAQHITNPLIYSTFQDEDFIGRVARLSRRVNPRLQSLRTIQRYLVSTRHELEHTEDPN